MVYNHTILAALRIYAQRGEDAAKGKVGGYVLNSHGNYVVNHGKSWNNHGFVFLNICGNPVYCALPSKKKSIPDWHLFICPKWKQNVPNGTQ